MSTSNALEMLINASCGGAGAAGAKMISYPLDGLKTTYSKKDPSETWSDVIRQWRSRGVYAGLNAKLAKSVTQRFVYFYIYEGLCQAARTTKGDNLSTNTLLVVGYLSEALGIPIFSPLETVTVQMQTGKGKESMLEVYKRIYKNNGIMGFYGAVDAYLFCAFQPAINLTIFNKVKQYLLGEGSGELSFMQAFWLGAISRAIGTISTYPINLGRTVIQARTKVKTSAACPKTDQKDQTKDQDDKQNDNDDARKNLPVSGGLFSVILSVWKREGFFGLYKGVQVDVFQAMIDSAVQMMIKEKIYRLVRTIIYLLYTILTGQKVR